MSKGPGEVPVALGSGSTLAGCEQKKSGAEKVGWEDLPLAMRLKGNIAVGL